MPAAVAVAAIGAVATAYAANEASKSQKEAIRAQERMANEQAKVAREQLEFNKQQYEDWQKVFGPIQENLSEYYQGLDPDTYASRIKTRLETQFEMANHNLDRSLAQRGIEDSGLAMAMKKDLNQQLAISKTLANQQAEDIVEQKKLRFLGLGLGNQGALLSNVNSSYGAQAGAYGNLAAMYGGQAAMYGSQAARAGQALGNLAGSLAYAYGRGIFSAPTTTPAISNPASNGYDFNQWRLIK